MMSACCTLRLKRRRAFSRDSPSCSRISAKQTHAQARPEGPSSYYKALTGSQVGWLKKLREEDSIERRWGPSWLIQLKAHRLRKLSLVRVAGVEAVHTEFEGGCYVQDIRGAG